MSNLHYDVIAHLFQPHHHVRRGTGRVRVAGLRVRGGSLRNQLPQVHLQRVVLARLLPSRHAAAHCRHCYHLPKGGATV